MKGLQVLKIFIYAILTLAFLLQVWDSVSKFIKGKTTMSRTRIPLKKQKFPVITLCPGFKNPNDTVRGLATYFDRNPNEGT